MNNLVINNVEKDFFIWVDMNNIMCKHNYELGCFFAFENNLDFNSTNDNLEFIPNPNFGGFVSPFQSGLTYNYFMEYNLELSRRDNFKNYPSRLTSLFLFENESIAMDYFSNYLFHVQNRQLKKVRTVGGYKYSVHDLTWVDFMRERNHFLLNDSIDFVTQSYWSGKKTNDHNLISSGDSWKKKSLNEVLFLGRVNFLT